MTVTISSGMEKLLACMKSQADSNGFSIRGGEDTDRVSLEPPSSNNPAVGIVVPDASAGAVARVVLRARQNGHQVLVACSSPEEPEPEALTFARQLNAMIVTPEADTTEAELWDLLRDAARDRGYPGLIRHRDPDEYVDYERSLERFETGETYAVDAERGVPPDQNANVGVLVGIPAYNEATTIADIVTEVAVFGDEVLVVDDGSDDDTAARAREAGAVVVEHDRNQGYGSALRTLFEEADRRRASRLVVIDGDGQHDVADVPRLVDRLDETGAQIVIGNRFSGDTADIPVYRRFGLWVINTLTNASMGVVGPKKRIMDTQSGFRAYDREIIRTLADSGAIGTGMAASTDILYHARKQGYDIAEVDTTIRYDVEDASSQNPVTHGLVLVSNILRTIEREHPITILGVPGFLMAVLGLSFGYWSITSYVQTGMLPFGPALASSFFLLFGIFACFTAIILHSLETHL